MSMDSVDDLEHAEELLAGAGAMPADYCRPTCQGDGDACEDDCCGCPCHDRPEPAPDPRLSPSEIPGDHPVRPLVVPTDVPGATTCGTCGLTWDDDLSTSMTPVPSARCPFEPFHR